MPEASEAGAAIPTEMTDAGRVTDLTGFLIDALRVRARHNGDCYLAKPVASVTRPEMEQRR